MASSTSLDASSLSDSSEMVDAQTNLDFSLLTRENQIQQLFFSNVSANSSPRANKQLPPEDGKTSVITPFSSPFHHRSSSNQSLAAEIAGTELGIRLGSLLEEKVEESLKDELKESFESTVGKENAERFADALSKEIAPDVAATFAREVAKEVAEDLMERDSSESTEEAATFIENATREAQSTLDVVVETVVDELVREVEEFVDRKSGQGDLDQVIDRVAQDAADEVADQIEEGHQNRKKEGSATLRERAVFTEEAAIILQDVLRAVVEACNESSSHAPILQLGDQLATLGICNNAQELLDAVHEVRDKESKREKIEGAATAVASGVAIGEEAAATALTGVSLAELTTAVEQLASATEGLGISMWGLEVVEDLAEMAGTLSRHQLDTREDKKEFAINMGLNTLRLARDGLEASKDIALMAAHGSSAVAALSIAAPMAAIPLQLVLMGFLAKEMRDEVKFLDDAREILRQRPNETIDFEVNGAQFVHTVTKFLAEHLEISPEERQRLEDRSIDLARIERRKMWEFERLVGKDAAKIAAEWLRETREISGDINKAAPQAAHVLLAVMSQSWHRQVKNISEIGCASILIAGAALSPVSHGASLGAAGITVAGFKLADLAFHLNAKLADRLAHGRDWSPTHRKAILAELQELAENGGTPSSQSEINEMPLAVGAQPSSTSRRPSFRHNLLQRARSGAQVGARLGSHVRNHAARLRTHSSLVLDSARDRLRSRGDQMSSVFSDLREMVQNHN